MHVIVTLPDRSTSLHGLTQPAVNRLITQLSEQSTYSTDQYGGDQVRVQVYPETVEERISRRGRV